MAADCRIYLITPAQFELEVFLPRLELALEDGLVACLQLRLKDMAEEEVERYARAIIPICHKHDVQFILNDNPALAVKVGADGVHIGEEDGTAEEARMVIGEEMVLGVSCYNSMHRAMEAGEQGADYVAFGAFYPTTTKAKTVQAELARLQDWTMFAELPCVAIGGITDENVTPLVRSGADFVAIVRYVWEHPEGEKVAVQKLAEMISGV